MGGKDNEEKTKRLYTELTDIQSWRSLGIMCVCLYYIRRLSLVCVRSILLINATWNVCTNCPCNSKCIKSLGLHFYNNGGKKNLFTSWGA